MKIELTVRNVYGIDRFYPVCNTAKLLSKLISRPTFTDDHIQILKKLGYKPELVMERKAI